MAPTTRSQLTPEGALTHVLTAVLKVADDSPIKKALAAAGATTIIDFMELSRADLSEVTYGTNTKLGIADRNKLLAVQGWYRAQVAPTLGTWSELTDEVFQAYRQTATYGSPPTTVLILLHHRL